MQWTTWQNVRLDIFLAMLCESFMLLCLLLNLANGRTKFMATVFQIVETFYFRRVPARASFTKFWNANNVKRLFQIFLALSDTVMAIDVWRTAQVTGRGAKAHGVYIAHEKSVVLDSVMCYPFIVFQHLNYVVSQLV
jgi:hypothetical protein